MYAARPPEGARTAARQCGHSLIEVLVALLVLSLGLLGSASFLAYAAQMPRLAGQYATAVQLAQAHVERMRANPQGLAEGFYDLQPAAAPDPAPASADCRWPACTPRALAQQDLAAAQQAVRQQLPQGQLLARCRSTPCGPGALGDVWVVWEEMQTFASFQAAGSDACPPGLPADAASRCIHLRFSL